MDPEEMQSIIQEIRDQIDIRPVPGDLSVGLPPDFEVERGYADIDLKKIELSALPLKVGLYYNDCDETIHLVATLDKFLTGVATYIVEIKES